jgi:hypothetical protein
MEDGEGMMFAGEADSAGASTPAVKHNTQKNKPGLKVVK